MGIEQDATTASDASQEAVSRAGWPRVPRTSFPRRTWAFVRPRWRTLVQVVLVLAGLVVQLWLIGMVEGLVDLTISLMEVWAELARKHLELTL